MADLRVQIRFNDNTYFEGIIPDTLPFTSIDTIPDVFQVSYCGQLWRKKTDIVEIKTEDVAVGETNLGFVLRNDPTWQNFIETLYGELGKDVWDAYVTANKDETFVTGNVIYP